MKKLVKTHKRHLTGAVLAVVLALSWWVFGWFGGTIDVMDFSADQVESIELFHYWLSDERVIVTEKEAIQAVIDAVNGFRHTGVMLKYPGKLIAGGGELWYEVTVHFADGGSRRFVFTQLEKDPIGPEAEWRYGGFGTCRGSMDVVNGVLAAYAPSLPR